MNVRIVITADHSPTLFVPELNEHYGSVNGAYNESMHVFIKEGLRQIQGNDISILEIGFGTGLNTLLTFLESVSTEKHIYYETLEKFPLNDLIIQDLASEPIFQNEIFKKLHQSPWDIKNNISENFTLKKVRMDLLEYKPSRFFNLIYFDAFAPDKQPELWTKSVFESLFAVTLPGGILVTYSSKGTVKQALRDTGYSVSRIKGPEGKRHMVRARKEC
jgi:tRNA U34 5-methylaminomethyl-2-thiouridine-forming methyltransferase MnmC